MPTQAERDARRDARRVEREDRRENRRLRRKDKREKRRVRRKALITALKKLWIDLGEKVVCSKLEELRKLATDKDQDGEVSNEELARWIMQKPKARIPDTWMVTLPGGIRLPLEDLVAGAVYIIIRGLLILCKSSNKGKINEDKFEADLEAMSEEDDVIDDVDDEDSDFRA